MERVRFSPRPNWRDLAIEQAFDFYANEGHEIWHEGAAYRFTLQQIEEDLEAPTAELYAMCLALADEIRSSDALLRRLQIPEPIWPMLRGARTFDLSLYGRFDLAYDGRGPAKLLEFNADTPTALFETAVFQWGWLEDMKRSSVLLASADQFNSVHERLIARLAEVVPPISRLHLTAMTEYPEDLGTIRYIANCALQAGRDVRIIDIGQIGLGSLPGALRDDLGNEIQALFKLYPWEWFVRDRFADALPLVWTRFVEPAWKMVLSNKGILPLLWERHPGHPNLLPAYFEDDPRKFELGADFVRKPLYGREGGNVVLVRGSAVAARQTGPYGTEGYVRQALAPVPLIDGRHVIIGSWVVGDAPAGIILRESPGPISDDGSQLLPHFIAP